MAIRLTAILNLLIVSFLMLSCTNRAEVPSEYDAVGSYPSILPDYVGVTIPCNIAPLNFLVDGKEQCVARISYKDESHLFGDGNQVIIEPDVWRSLLSKAKDDSLKVELFGKDNGRWTAFRPFYWHVSADPVDEYVTYRLIHPSYGMYNEMSIVQRQLSSFDETVVYNNKNGGSAEADHCVNCHAFQNYDSNRFQLHVRENHGGTILYDGNTMKEVSLKRPSNPMGAAYPAWHPTQNFIAYSANQTIQHFFTTYKGKIEVQDTKSDLVLYDVSRDEAIRVTDTPFELEVFPSWSPDGKWLYYSMANVADTTTNYVVKNYKAIRYNVYRRPFNLSIRTFGEAELVLDASDDSVSAVLPRISPDGRWMLTSQAPYGVFHIWHPESDLYLTNLETRQTFPLSAANSPQADSFHNWSSNSRWIIFTSRRMDGNYSHLYFAHVDVDGRVSKAFEMPWRNPEECLTSLWSFNVPEFSHNPIKPSSKEIFKVINN